MNILQNNQIKGNMINLNANHMNVKISPTIVGIIEYNTPKNIDKGIKNIFPNILKYL